MAITRERSRLIVTAPHKFPLITVKFYCDRVRADLKIIYVGGLAYLHINLPTKPSSPLTIQYSIGASGGGESLEMNLFSSDSVKRIKTRAKFGTRLSQFRNLFALGIVKLIY